MNLVQRNFVIIVLLTSCTSCYCNNTKLKFIPISPGCTVQWLLENHITCEWCNSVFDLLIRDFRNDYNPSIISNGNSSNLLLNDNGNCRVALFLSTEFELISDFFRMNLNDYDTSLWYFLLQNFQKLEFLHGWKQTINEKFRYLHPKAVLVVHHEEFFDYQNYGM